MPVRKAAFASDHGFYPSTRSLLLKMLDGFMPAGAEADPAVAVVAPHAGYVFSGGVAGAVYARVLVPNDVILLTTNHVPEGAEFALYDEGRWETPLGDVPIATELVAAIVAECPMVEADPHAHDREHSGEVHLPFLRRRNPSVRVAPIKVKQSRLPALRELGLALARAADRLDRPVLLVASTDMTHYEPEQAARERDHLVIEKILALDEGAMWETVHRHRITMCGAGPVAAGLVYAKARGAATAELVDYKTSADSGLAGPEEVVGYAGIIIR
jgi:AmmeMemoRadiSam system protein B